jgi:hypothetical protein
MFRDGAGSSDDSDDDDDDDDVDEWPRATTLSAAAGVNDVWGVALADVRGGLADEAEAGRGGEQRIQAWQHLSGGETYNEVGDVRKEQRTCHSMNSSDLIRILQGDGPPRCLRWALLRSMGCREWQAAVRRGGASGLQLRKDFERMVYGKRGRGLKRTKRAVCVTEDKRAQCCHQRSAMLSSKERYAVIKGALCCHPRGAMLSCVRV